MIIYNEKYALLDERLKGCGRDFFENIFLKLFYSLSSNLNYLIYPFLRENNSKMFVILSLLL